MFNSTLKQVLVIFIIMVSPAAILLAETKVNQQQAPETIEIGRQKQLLVDDYAIASKENIEIKLGQPVKKGIVMGPTLPTDFHPTYEFKGEKPHLRPDSYGCDMGYRVSVVYNEQVQRFQMVYRGSKESMTCYAESLDGINWRKPLVAGNGKTNIVRVKANGKSGKYYEAAMTIDPSLKWGHPEKYKTAYNPGNTRCAIGYSADGVNWKAYNDGKNVTGRAADTANQILWDPIQQRYLLVTRQDLAAKGGKGEVRATRIMKHRNNDLMNDPENWKTIATVAVDDPLKELNPHRVVKYQMEAMTVWPYENVYFGLMHVLAAGELTGSKNREVKDPRKRPDEDVIDLYIGTSRDGVNFDRSWIYQRKPFLERGEDDTFDKSMIHCASEIITLNDKHMIYYYGSYSQHHAPSEARIEPGRIGLAVLPLDRFIAQKAVDGQTGVITTKYFKVDGNAIIVNVEAENGSFKAEVLDEDGQVISGFTNCAKNIDSIKHELKWAESSNTKDLKGKKIALRFALENASLYSFTVEKHK